MSSLDPRSPVFQPVPKSHTDTIRNVWRHNLEEEIKRISHLAQHYPVIAMDTEFPGIVFHVDEEREDLAYQTVRVNVNHLKMIQLGITLGTESGECPEPTSTWQFNFEFNLEEDFYSQDSIDLLKSSGIEFALHKDFGIEPRDFAAHFITSGLVLNEDVKWVSFHSAYDFGYLLRALTGEILEESEQDFLDKLKLYFLEFYDIKMMVSAEERMKGGLNRLADVLNVTRVGQAHQAGSDALVTLETFNRVKEELFNHNIPQELVSVLFGLGSGRQPGFVYRPSLSDSKLRA